MTDEPISARSGGDHRSPRSTKHGVPPRFAISISMWLRRFFLRAADRALPAQVALLEHVHQFAGTYLLAAFAELGIADHLASGPKTADELAAMVHCDADAMHRALRAAAACNLVRLDKKGRFHATRLLGPMRSNDPSATADWCRYIGSPSLQVAWADLAETIRSGRNGFHRINGMSTFEWFDAHPDEGRRFASGLGGLTRAEAQMVIAAYPFPETGTVCDIAGGAGVLLGEILRTRPGLDGVLVEAPLVLAEAAIYLASIGLADRVQLVEGDLFGQIEATADVYLLKWILHDWDDATCERIIKNVASAMPGGARLVVIEGNQERNEVHPRFSMIDLQMLTMSEGGKERSRGEFERLLTNGGMHPLGTRRTATDLLLVEASVLRPV
ncbi:MAG: O-methyltransferase [Acidimicrobiaceae bacterium]|nr:O-methyltransferase [Acidimicrobiaceae bacterium]